ncbi:hypothetical protein ACI3LY_003025 [Candidozyma auris]|nr:hypothetical protein QG37_00913 [[Candida] auris]PIS54099.1 hypothetical protein CJI97_003797 [[Candida] auris]
MFPMVTISDNTFSKVPPHHPRLHRKSGSGHGPFDASEGAANGIASGSFTEAFLKASNRPQFHHLPTPAPSATTSVVEQKHDESNEKQEQEIRLMDFIDVPSLVSDNEEEESDAESSHSSKGASSVFSRPAVKSPPASAAAEQVKRSLKEENQSMESIEKSRDEPLRSVETELAPQAEELPSATEATQATSTISDAQFKLERSQLMKIAVKYVAMKIHNSFPPESARTIDPEEMPLDQFLLILTSRLQLTLPLFMKGIIYLFRYMDIIYLLRYLNQSNNFLNYTEMGFNLKKLIVGCFKLTLARERISKDWSGVTGLANAEINTIVKTVVKRLNGKLAIKNIELLRLKSEIYRFVKMVVKEVK